MLRQASRTVMGLPHNFLAVMRRGSKCARSIAAPHATWFTDRDPISKRHYSCERWPSSINCSTTGPAARNFRGSKCVSRRSRTKLSRKHYGGSEQLSRVNSERHGDLSAPRSRTSFIYALQLRPSAAGHARADRSSALLHPRRIRLQSRTRFLIFRTPVLWSG